MKKHLFFIAVSIMAASVLTSCSDDDTSEPSPESTQLAKGMFVVNSGNSSDQLSGSLTYIGDDGSVSQNVFATANGRALGMTPNDAIVNGNKLYIVVTGENTIEVVDKNTLKSIKQISTPELMGDDKGKNPRRLIALGRYVCVSTFDGYVAAIDTVDFSAANIYKVGSYPEGMAASGENLYVANSDYGQCINPSISRISLTDGSVEEKKDELINNPTSLAALGSGLYVLDYGSYDAAWNQVGAGVYRLTNGTVTKVADATMMAADHTHNLIYTINAPYTTPATPITYNVYDITTGENKTFITGDDIDSPAAITVDPVTGDVYIASYKTNPDTGYADYSGNGYVNKYDSEGNLIGQYETGVGPTAFVFNK